MTPIFYMSQPDELRKHPKASQVFYDIGQAAATAAVRDDVYSALWAWFNFTHAFDDILDTGNLDDAGREKLLRQCADFLHAALYGVRGSDAALLFKASYLAAATTAGMDADRRALAVKAFDDFAGNLVANPFFRTYSQQHLAMLDSMIFRAMRGDQLAQHADPAVRALAPAVRCGDTDFLVHVAKLVGGWPLACKVSAEATYDLVP